MQIQQVTPQIKTKLASSVALNSSEVKFGAANKPQQPQIRFGAGDRPGFIARFFGLIKSAIDSMLGRAETNQKKALLDNPEEVARKAKVLLAEEEAKYEKTIETLKRAVASVNIEKEKWEAAKKQWEPEQRMADAAGDILAEDPTNVQAQQDAVEYNKKAAELKAAADAAEQAYLDAQDDADEAKEGLAEIDKTLDQLEVAVRGTINKSRIAKGRKAREEARETLRAALGQARSGSVNSELAGLMADVNEDFHVAGVDRTGKTATERKADRQREQRIKSAANATEANDAVAKILAEAAARKAAKAGQTTTTTATGGSTPTGGATPKPTGGDDPIEKRTKD